MKPQAELEQALAAPLERNRVRTRTDGRGGSLAYLETHDVIRRANDVFGFGQWGHVIDELRLIAAVPVEGKNGKKGVHVGYLCQIRLTVAGCQTVSGVGYGDAVEYRDSGPVTAHELAAKEAESDALKRALKNYGDQFGLALYDKDAARSTHITDSSKPAPAPSAGASKPAVQPPAAAGTGSQAAAGAQASAAPGETASAFTPPAGKAATKAQKKILTDLFTGLGSAGTITEAQFVKAAKGQGATGDGFAECIESLSMMGATDLIARLRNLEKNSAEIKAA